MPPCPAQPSPAAPAPATPLATANAGVPRESLCQRICRATAVRVVLLRAPAGHGKTELMRQARRQLADAGCATAWLDLDEGDNDVTRFVARLHQASLGLVYGSALPAGGAEVLRRLAASPQRFALFFDEVETLQDPAVLGLVRELIERLPPQGRLVLGSRSTPDLGLARLRAQGQVLDLDAEDLRFSAAETAACLAALARCLHLPPPSSDAAAQLQRLSEGWPAAVALAGRALLNSPQPERPGLALHRPCGQAQLLAAVLAQQPAPAQALLRQGCVLQRLEPALCDELLPGLHSAEWLPRLEAERFFLTACGAEGRPPWRWHRLLAELLRAQLQQQDADLARRLHLKAAAWYELQGRPDEAIDHAIQGGDLPHAVALLGPLVPSLIESGRLRRLARWLEALPETLVDATLALQIGAVWADCFTRGPRRALRRFEAWGLAQRPEPLARSHAAALQPLLLVLTDRHDEAAALAVAPAIGATAEPASEAGAGIVDIVRINTCAHALGVVGRTGPALALLEQARRAPAGNAFTRVYTEAMQGQLDLQAGRPRQATARFRLAGASPLRQQAYDHGHGNAWVGVLHASALYEADQLDAASQLLNLYRPLVHDLGLPDHLILCHRLDSRIALAQGDADAAQQSLAELETLGQQRDLPRAVAAARLEQARQLGLRGRGLAAREALALADLPGVWPRVQRLCLAAHDVEDLALGRLRWQVGLGDAAAALAGLDEELQRARQAGRQRRALQLQLLQLLAWQRCGDIASALQQLQPLLRQCSQQGQLRALIDEGPALLPLLQRVEELDSPGFPADAIATEHLQRLQQRLRHEASALPQAEAQAGTPADGGFTPQERRVLQLLAEGHATAAIATRLAISDSTVRTHLRSLNLKLGAHTRTEAVARARRLALIREA
ncbi:MAG: helix-turn-helix transcriptional regulator [Burkholderiaceae bacterium]|nr:helix-turn-helix transcriptional regulator [Burkholderiaceae bacterium]